MVKYELYPERSGIVYLGGLYTIDASGVPRTLDRVLRPHPA